MKCRAEDDFSKALNERDFRPCTLAKLLDGLNYQPVKATRDGVFGGKTGDLVRYFTYGLFSHGGVVGLTNKTREQDQVTRYLNGYAKHHLGTEATWTSISISCDVGTEIHHDYHNLRGSLNYTTSLGQAAGGGLWIEDKNLTEDEVKEGVRWKRTATGQWFPGKVHETCGQFVRFDPFLKHSTEPWTGRRWAVTYHTTRNLYKAGHAMKKFLKGCGFLPLPRLRTQARNNSTTEATPSRERAQGGRFSITQLRSES